MTNLSTWIVVSPRGLEYIGLHDSELSAWTTALGWPDQAEIDEAKAKGWYAAKAQVTWRKDRRDASNY